MKKFLTIITVIAGAYGASAQGFVNFNNSVSASTKVSINSVPGGPATGLTPAGAGNFYYELFFSKNSASQAGAGTIPSATPGSLATSFVTGDANWTDGLAGAASSSTAGRVLGGANEVVTGVAGASSANFVIIGWSANIGSTVAALEAYLANPTPLASTAYVGESQIANLTLGDGGNTSTPNLMTGTTIPGFVLGAIAPVTTPEPTTIALGVMGAASLLALRRKQA